MEIRRFHTSHAATCVDDIVEGRLVVRVSNVSAVGDGYGADPKARYFGTDQLQTGVRVPVTQDEANLARGIVAFTVPIHKSPYYISYPAYSWSLRQGWDRTGNLPMSPDIHMVWLGQKEGLTIPSGWNAVVYEGGTFTVGSGHWVYSASILPGVEIEASKETGHEGKPQVKSTGTAVGMCREVTWDRRLTFDLYH